MLHRVGRAAFTLGILALSTLSCSNDQSPISPGDSGQPPQVEQLSVSIGVKRDSIAYGSQRQFSARVQNQFNVARVAPVTWRSSNSEVMTVTSDGYVSAVGAGTALLIASIPSGAADSATISVYGVIETLSVIPEVVTIPEGDTIRFQVNYGNVPGAAPGYISWSTSDPSIATVDASGRLAAIKQGDVQLVARYGARSANADVKVNRSTVSSVIITPSASTIQPGGSVTLIALVQDALGHVLTDRNVVWSSSTTDVATVDGNGVVTGVSKGYTLIEAKSEGKRATASVTVGPRAVSAVSVSLDRKLLTAGQQTTAHATVYGTDGSVIPSTEQPVAWQSSNPSIATVTSSGTVTAIAAGSVSISAISGGHVGSDGASVQSGVAQSITISPSAPSVLQGAQTQLSAIVSDQSGAPLSGAVVSWTSSNPAVATVSSSGVVTGVSAGTSTITATSGSLSATAVLTVTLVPVASVTVTPTSANLDVGGTTTFVATPRDGSGAALSGRVVTWSSANPTVATVSNSGVVTALAQGSVVITATADGKSGTAEVDVNAPAPSPVASITVVLNSATINAGQSTQAVATLYDASGHVLTGRTITWSSSAPEVASVSSSGLVTGVGAGSVAILATSGGQTGLATLTVNPNPAPVASVVVALSPSLISQGGTSQTQVTLQDAQGNTLTGRTIGYASSNSSVATVSGTGTATGVGGGTAEIMAVSESQTGQAPLQVTTTSGATTQPASLTINAPSTVLTAGQSEQLTATIKDAGGNVLSGLTVAWETHDTNVITIDASGLVKAVGPGSATVYAWQSSTAYSQIGLTVQADTSTSAPTLAPVASVTVTLNSPSLAVGQSTQAVATMKDAYGNVLAGRSVVWTSTNLAVATVTQSGVATAIAAGTAQIQAVSEGKTGSATLTVLSGTTSPPPPPLSGSPAELPRVSVNSNYVAPTGQSINVPMGGNLQAALNNAKPGDEIVLASGATFTGNFVLPAKSGSGWITVRTQTSLPPAGTRMRPSLAGGFAKIITPNSDAAIKTAPGAANWRLMGLEVTISPSVTIENYGIVWFGDPTQSSLSAQGANFILDRSYVHGQSTSRTRRCVALNSGTAAVVDSWLSDCHDTGADAQAIAGWTGPGPYKIVNNYLEGSGENVIFGGADPRIQGLIPSDIEIRGNHIAKPASWIGGPWEIKNLIELKNAQRVLIEGNVLEGSWAQAQTGFAVVMKSENQSGGCSWCTSKDVTFRRNLIRNVGGGINISGGGDTPYRHDSTSRRFDISENWMESVNEGQYQGIGRLFQLVSNAWDVRVSNNVALSSNCLSFLSLDVYPTVTRLNFANDVVSGCRYGMIATGLGSGLPSWGTTVNSTWSSVAIIGTNSGATYPPGTSWYSSLTSALSSGAGIARSTIDAQTAGVVVSP